MLPYAPPKEQSLGTVPVSRRRLWDWLTFMLLWVGFALFVTCVYCHVCMCGHLAHVTGSKLRLHIGLDVLLGTVFTATFYAALHSNIRWPRGLGGGLFAMYLNHILLANGAGYLFVLFDAPLMLVILAYAIPGACPKKRVETKRTDKPISASPSFSFNTLWYALWGYYPPTNDDE